jgi:hypothetical protein
MTAHLGIQSHPRRRNGRRPHRRYDPVGVPLDTSLRLRALARRVPAYQPFDIVRHHGHLGFVPPHLGLSSLPQGDFIRNYIGTSPYVHNSN